MQLVNWHPSDPQETENTLRLMQNKLKEEEKRLMKSSGKERSYFSVVHRLLYNPQCRHVSNSLISLAQVSVATATLPLLWNVIA